MPAMGSIDAVINPLPPTGNAAHLDAHLWAFEHRHFVPHLDDAHFVVGFLQDRELFPRKPGVELRRAPGSGSVRIGNMTLDATGCGTPDHNRGIGDMKSIVDRWYWGRLHAGDLTLVSAAVLTTGQYAAIWATPLMSAIGGRVVLSTGEVSVTAGPPVFDRAANRDYPTWLHLRSEDTVDLTLDVRDVIHAHDPLADVPVTRNRPVKPIINRFLARPGCSASDRTTLSLSDSKGLTHQRTGSTLHEMVALR